MAESSEKMGVSNPESLHQISKDTSKKTKSGWLNPGTPESPLVSADQMPKAQVGGKGDEMLNNNLIKG